MLEDARRLALVTAAVPLGQSPERVTVALTAVLWPPAPQPDSTVVTVWLHPERVAWLCPPVLLPLRELEPGRPEVDWGGFDPLAPAPGPAGDPPFAGTPTGLGAATAGFRVTGVVPGDHVAREGRHAWPWARVRDVTFTGLTVAALAPAVAEVTGSAADLLAVVTLDLIDGDRAFAARRLLRVPMDELHLVVPGAILPAAYLPKEPGRSATIRWHALHTPEARVPTYERAALRAQHRGRRRPPPLPAEVEGAALVDGPTLTFDPGPLR